MITMSKDTKDSMVRVVDLAWTVEAYAVCRWPACGWPGDVCCRKETWNAKLKTIPAADLRRYLTT